MRGLGGSSLAAGRLSGLFLPTHCALRPGGRAGTRPCPSTARGCPAVMNLTCYRCFKVASEALCTPAACSPTDRVCVSHTVSFFLQSRVKVSLSKRCAPQCPSTSAVYEWPSDTQAPGRITRQCCGHSLCNRAPPDPWRPRALRGALLLPLGLALPGALL